MRFPFDTTKLGIEICFEGRRPDTTLKLVINAGDTCMSHEFKEVDSLEWPIRL